MQENKVVEGTQDVESTDAQVAETRTLPDLTPYAASKVVTAMLAKANVKDAKGAPLKVSSQAMYSRASKNVVKAYRGPGSTGSQTWWIDGANFARWAKRYVDGYVNGTATQSRTDYDTLALQYEI